jgi:transcriptional regulator with XRE-family HTH domain
MVVRRFRIKLRAAHEATGLTPYRVAKETGIAQATVRKYIERNSIEADYLPLTVIRLAEYYGVDWRNPSVIEVIEDESDPEISTPLLASA